MTLFWPPTEALAQPLGEAQATDRPLTHWAMLATRRGGPAFAPPVTGTVFTALLNERSALAALGNAVHAPPYKAPPRAPVLAIKPRNTLVGHRVAVAVPATGDVEVGATLGIVIGRTACRVAAADALAHVAGYVVVNDLSLPQESYYRPGLSLRARDGFCPVGPAVVARALVAHADALEVTVAIDGTAVWRGSTGGRIRPIAQLIADVSEFMTLSPGDVLTLGVAAGAPHARAGQVVTVRIDGIGTLETPLVAEEASS